MAGYSLLKIYQAKGTLWGHGFGTLALHEKCMRFYFCPSSSENRAKNSICGEKQKQNKNYQHKRTNHPLTPFLSAWFGLRGGCWPTFLWSKDPLFCQLWEVRRCCSKILIFPLVSNWFPCRQRRGLGTAASCLVKYYSRVSISWVDFQPGF